MITLYTWTTPNGRKASIMLEELGLEYRIRPVNIGKDEQFAGAFLAISPNNKIPAIIDDEGPGGPIAIFESGAILTYLAEKHGRFLAKDGPARWMAIEWLYWQVGGLGPMLGQLGFFVRSEEKSQLAIERFTDEADRLLGVMDRRLGEARYLAGDDYSIADIASYGWTAAAFGLLKDTLGGRLTGKTHIQRWLEEVGGRPAVIKGMQIPQV
jgi:GST-like protein